MTNQCEHATTDEFGRIVAESIALRGMRGVIATRMMQSLRDSAQLTLHRRISATALTEFKQRIAEGAVSLNALIVSAAARTLAAHPMVNATLEGQAIFRYETVHVGVAVALKDGLVVPVVKHADHLGLMELQAEVARLAAAARQGKLAMADVEGGTFTVSNLGSLGVDAFTPIVNPPQVAILGVGRFDHGSMMLSLTIDHRALDGAPGGRFLSDLAAVLEDPVLCLAT